MIERIIDSCAANRFLVFIGTIVLVGWGIWAMRATPLDAVPDISDVQVIVSTEWMGRSPDLIEDQITYPIVSALISTPNVKAVRGFTDFGISYVYVIFQDRTDMYWARSRVVEYLQGIRGQLRRASAGCSNTRWSTNPASTTSPSSAASRTGTFDTGSPPCRASPKSPASAASSNSTK